ncbi:hypothetical protein NDU88_001898 [Pleurodeles waltl]|uniref:Uncharacterized protein n=1 Tax=Pleurodeles waltl TaxID=8319 RepID=A0AAV7P8H1_PLEWA|nr:hypothetical protein NDU88_001898 [Pleurodeles waltl]
MPNRQDSGVVRRARRDRRPRDQRGHGGALQGPNRVRGTGFAFVLHSVPYLISDPMAQPRRAIPASAGQRRPMGAPRGSVVCPAVGVWGYDAFAKSHAPDICS